MICDRCKTTDQPLLVHSTKTLKDGSKKIRYWCRPCNNAQAVKYRKEHPETYLRASKASRKRYPEKERAREKAREKIPLKPCEVCGETRSQRHHPDYSKPLDVVFLCSTHHREVHKEVLVL